MPGPGDEDLIEHLRAGDEDAFVNLVNRYHASMLRVASTFVPSRAVAEEVVQDTWLGVIRGLPRFEGRSSLKTWIFRILVNRARTTGVREPRTVELDTGDGLDRGRFTVDGSWREPPIVWTDDIEDRLAAPEMAAKIQDLVAQLPESQRQVVTLRDIEGLSSREVCDLLGLSEGNQRVLLHRGRTRVRAMLEDDVKGWEK
ncbi:MAG TPA: sigma-70 family RNA polymerase sigma factor [Acidimicrobiales bacterium]|nr:sigma-70 family RNA polymerase sigma factor [Acidimicrobiales bacterium]